MSLLEREQEKYKACWDLPEYTKFSPGEVHAAMFEEIACPEPGQRAIDLGCGDGQGGRALEKMHLKVTYLDFVKVGNLSPFIQQPLWEPIRKGPFDYGYCCDVMEHLPPEFTMLAIANMRAVCTHLFLSISFLPDNLGEKIGETLHLTVRPFTWWRDNLSVVGELVEARDMIGEGIFYLR